MTEQILRRRAIKQNPPYRRNGISLAQQRLINYAKNHSPTSDDFKSAEILFLLWIEPQE